MANTTRTIYKRVKIGRTSRVQTLKFVVTFDEWGVVDTIEQVEIDGKRKLLSSNNVYAKAILRNADTVFSGTLAPVGFTWG